MIRIRHGRYFGPLWEGDNGGASGGGAPPSLPNPPAPAPAPAQASNNNQNTNNGGAGTPATPPKPPRQRKPRTSVSASTSGGARVQHTTAGGTSVSGTVSGPGDVIDAVSELPTPGGLVLLLAILLLFLFAIVPVTPKGKTRLALLWDTLRGKTQLPPPAAASQSSSSSNSSAGPLTGTVPNEGDLQQWLAQNPPSAGGNAGSAGMVPADAIAATGYHRVQDAPVPESVAAAPADGYGYVDAWQGPTAPQPYYGENVYDAPVFPELE